MRKIQSLTSWEEIRNKLLKNQKYAKLHESMMSEYELSNSLIKIRLKKKISQKELATKIGSKQPVISRIETMTAKPTFSLLNKISKALNVQLRIFFQS